MMTAEQQEMQQQLIRAINEAIAGGKPWAAFDDQSDKQLNSLDLHFFASAAEAEGFCGDANGADTFADQVFNSDNYIFLQAENLAHHFGQTPETIRFSETAVARQMADQNLYVPAGHSFQQLEAALAKGLVYPVLWQRSIDPLKEIADYHVIGHQHSGGQIYETGHSYRVLEIFGRYHDARSFMDNAVLYNELSDKGADYLIAGRFHGRQLELDMEDYALPHAGLTLVTAHHNYQHGHDYHELHSLFKPAAISQYFFAGLKNGELSVYNDKLDQTILTENQRPFYLAHFNNEYLTTKNCNIMLNQKNHDYLKNQLLYTGFGDGLNEPLKAKMLEGATDFTLDHSKKFGQDEVNSKLHFSKSDQTDLYFFNKFDLSLK